MKNLIFTFLLPILFFSCSGNDDLSHTEWDNDEYPQYWQLAKLSSPMTVGISSGDEIPDSNYYLFRADSTFVKHLIINNVNIEAQGTFSKRNEIDGKSLKLKFKSGYQAIESCYGDSTEILWFPESKSNLFNTWHLCDGPVLEYKRIK